MRKILVLIILTALLFLISCKNDNDRYDKKEKDNRINALTVTLEANLECRIFKGSCGYFSSLKTNVILIPLNKEIIDATIKYKVAINNLSPEEEQRLIDDNYNKLLTTDKSAFVLLVINGESLDNDEKIYFENFKKNVAMKLENGKILNLKEFTQNFTEPLNPGWNTGYLFFDNFRIQAPSSYSIHFAGLKIKCGDKIENISKWAWSFNESEIDYLSLFQHGLNVEEVRSKYVISSYEKIGLEYDDVIAIIKILFKILV